MPSFTKHHAIFTILIVASSCSSSKRADPIEIESRTVNYVIQEANEDPLFGKDTLTCKWWTLFNDEQLNEFIEIAIERNPTIQIAEASVSLAAAAAANAKASLYPSLFYGADVLRAKLSETGLIPFDTSAAEKGTSLPPGAGIPTALTAGKNQIPVYFTQYETEFTLAYEFDFWKKNTNTLRSAIGQMQAKMADAAFIRMELGIAIAQIYFKLQTNYLRQELFQALVKSKIKYLDLLRKCIENSIGDIQSFHNAEMSLAFANKGLFEIQNAIAADEYQLKAYLAGNFNEKFQKINIKASSIPRIALPEKLPLHLIAHRPDIIAQLWLIESAGKQIDVARAGFYPDFNISALFGFQTLHLHELFNWPSSYFNVNPALSLPIFDGGRLAANLKSSEIDYDLAIYKYNDLILNAVKEVLSAITFLKNANQQLEEFEKIALYRQELFQLSTLRLKNGLNTSLEEAAADEDFLIAEDQKILATGKMLEAVLLLIKALGGGYAT